MSETDGFETMIGIGLVRATPFLDDKGLVIKMLFHAPSYTEDCRWWRSLTNELQKVCMCIQR